MLQPWFLDIDHTMRLHRSLIETYGGSEGIRDVGLLHSALAMPQASFGGEFLHRDLFEMSAAYLFHIVQNHPFANYGRSAEHARDMSIALDVAKTYRPIYKMT
ncbi:MAG: type II toxin-antitoxin system death-on-curing family toxin, partial [Planctomycetota bacterium]